MIKVPKDPVPGGSCSSCLIESCRLAVLSHGERTLVSLPLLAEHQPDYISPYHLTFQPSSQGFRVALEVKNRLPTQEA